MRQVVKEITTPSKEYKAEIIKRSYDLFELCIYTWTREEVPEYGYISDWYWEPREREQKLSLTSMLRKWVAIA